MSLAACGGAASERGKTVSSPGPRAGCLGDRFPFGAPAASLTAHDSGRSIDVSVGALVQVTLLGRDAPGGRWPEPAIHGEAVVALVNPAETATVGTQLLELCAARAGSATLVSGSWQARVTVSP